MNKNEITHEEFLFKTRTLRTVLRLAIGWSSPSLFGEPVGVRESVAYLFNWRGARERHTLKYSSEQFNRHVFGAERG